jgi:hypothetical protein
MHDGEHQHALFLHRIQNPVWKFMCETAPDFALYDAPTLRSFNDTLNDKFDLGREPRPETA